MSQLQLNGTLVYPPGLWGGAGPAAGVSVEIIQNHQLPSSQTTIWSGTTDSSGNFSGQTAEWRRTVSILGRDALDPTDVLALTCHIIDDTGPRRQEKTFPFVWLGDPLPSPPIVLPWAPPTARKGRVNGADCWSFSDLARRARLGARTPLTVDLYLYGPDAGQSASQLRSIVQDMSSFAEATLEASTTSIAQRLSPNNAGALGLTLRSLQSARTFRQNQLQQVGTKLGNAGAATQRAGQPAVATAVTLAEIMAALVAAVFGLAVAPGVVIGAVAAAVAVEGVLVAIEVTMAAVAVVGATVAIVGNLPAILLQLAALLDALGLRDDAGILREASIVGQWYADNPWFGCVLDCCILVVLVVIACLMGMATFVAQIVSGPDGQTSLRLQTSS